MNFTDTIGEITSENYPSNYPDNVDTMQTILGGEGNTIWIRFEAMNIEDGGTQCDYDYISIVDGNGSILMDPTCGNNIPDVIQSFTSNVSVIFHSDGSVSMSGWKLAWSTEELLPLATTTPLPTTWQNLYNPTRTIINSNLTGM